MADEDTLRFYAQNASDYALHRLLPTGEMLSAFLARLPKGGKILELGCGNGVDAAFMLSEGFDVDATDGTPALAAEASRRIGRSVRVLRFEQLESVQIYDGVWAAASLLHVPAADLTDVLRRIHTAIRPGGHFTASYKGGTGEGRDDLGRYYNYPTVAQLATAYHRAGWLEVGVESRSGSGFDGQLTEWHWVSAQRR